MHGSKDAAASEDVNDPGTLLQTETCSSEMDRSLQKCLNLNYLFDSLCEPLEEWEDLKNERSNSWLDIDRIAGTFAEVDRTMDALPGSSLA